MKIYSLEHDEYNIKIVYTSDIDTEHIYKCDDTVKYIDQLFRFMRNPENKIDDFIESSIENEILKFSNIRKISEIEKNDYLKKANFSNI